MSKKIQYLRKKDINAVNDNLDSIIEKAQNQKIQLIEPKLDEFLEVRDIILNYIKNKKRIIYGGYAWNELIKQKSPKDVFYKDTSYTDIEFYSNKPIEDLIKICDILHSKKYKYIQGRNAQHKDTYTIFVNFQQYCDISYMPSNIFNAVMTENVDGLKLIHPKFIMVDILRQYNDPILSYWRIEKTIKRGKLLLENYPIELCSNVIRIDKLNSLTLELIDDLLLHIVKMKSILFFGQIATYAYLNPSINYKEQTTIYDNTQLILMSSNLKDDVYIIYNLILKYFIDNHKLDRINDSLKIEQYFPFFQFTDKHVEIILDNKVFLIIYGTNEICVQYNEINLNFKNNLYPIRIACFNLLFMYNLIQYHRGYSLKDYQMKNHHDYQMYLLLNAKNNFLDKNNKTILDETIFEDFKPNCMGTAVHPGIKVMLARYNRKLTPRSSIQSYSPEDNKILNVENYHFDNYSGNIINNPKELVYNIK